MCETAGYHGNCADGFTAAWILILDHHKTAAEDLAGIAAPENGYDARNWRERWEQAMEWPVRSVFDMGRSGAQVAWDFFYPGKPRPPLVDYVGDRDLWRFALPLSREVNAFVFAHEYTFENWNHLDRQMRNHMDVQPRDDRVWSADPHAGARAQPGSGRRGPAAVEKPSGGPNMTDLSDVLRVYKGSDGEATKTLYAELSGLGPEGAIAVNLFRACKTSERAKRYRGGDGRGSYRSQSYATKEWAIGNLCAALAKHVGPGSIAWGWGVDDDLRDRGDPHHHVLYIELPCGQVSFHTGQRLAGPDHARGWDGVPSMSAERSCRWAATLLARPLASPDTSAGAAAE